MVFEKLNYCFMKRFLLFFIALLFVNFVQAQEASPEIAKEVATKYFTYRKGDKADYKIKTSQTNYFKNKATFYVINFEKGGFVIVSGDYRVKPILGYSLTNSFPKKINNPVVRKWLENYSKEIDYIVSEKIDNTQTLDKWDDILNEKFSKGGKAVNKLLTTTWDQGSGYNSDCPSGTVTGCVATAMAQIMNYHEYPATGVGWHRYVHPQYGEQKAYFENGNYNWANMSDDTGNEHVAKLMYHCGVAVDMDFGTSAAGGSSSSTGDVPYILANYFKYDQGIDYVARSEYTDAEWINLLKAEIDASRPIQYRGNGDDGGHSFVLDGYTDNDEFHFNWGWSGSGDGNYVIGTLNPQSFEFNENNAAVIGIQPPGNEDFLFVRKYSGFPNESTNASYIDAVDNKVAWAIGRDGSGNGNSYHVCTRTKDGGGTWTAFEPSNFSNYEFSMVCGLSGDIAYIPIFSSAGTALIKTIDGGETWNNVLDGSSSSSFFNVVHFFNENDGFVQGDPENGEFELHTTSDGGNTWSRIDGTNIPDPLDDEMGTIGLYTAVGNNTIWFTTNKGRIFKSTDKGLNWNEYTVYTGPNNIAINTAFDDTELNGVAIIQTTIEASDQSDSTIYRYSSTSDGGATWTLFTPTGNFYADGVSSVPGVANKFVSVGQDYQTPFQGISYSTDGGNTWEHYAEYYQNYQMTSVDFVNDTKGYIGAYSGDGSGGTFVSGEIWQELTSEYSYNNEGNDTLYCSNQNITFTDDSDGFIDTYSWDFGVDATPATISGVGPHEVTYSSGGTKIITLTVTDKYGSKTSTKNILLDSALPDAIAEITGLDTVAIDEVGTYSVPNQSHTYYNWSISIANWSGFSISNTINITFGGDATEGNIEVYPFNGCGEGAVTTLNVTSKDPDPEPLTSVSPNPAYNEVTVPNTENTFINFFDLNGRKVYTEYAAEAQKVVDITHLRSGIYYIKYIKDGEELTHKLVVAR